MSFEFVTYRISLQIYQLGELVVILFNFESVHRSLSYYSRICGKETNKTDNLFLFVTPPRRGKKQRITNVV